MNGETHVDDLELAAFVDGGLDADARRRVEAHLVECADCRGMVTTTGRLLAAPLRRPRRRNLLLGAMAAAAVLLVTLVPRNEPSRSPPRTREAEVVGPTGIEFAPEAPPDRALVRPDTLAFYWTSAGEQATYQITVSSEAGAIVWTESTRRLDLPLPPAVAERLESGRDYYWQVDALLPDLRSASTGLRRFTVNAP
jgi:anti-sigma factor RsiW